jgi:hypothetical protein
MPTASVGMVSGVLSPDETGRVWHRLTAVEQVITPADIQQALEETSRVPYTAVLIKRIKRCDSVIRLTRPTWCR